MTYILDAVRKLRSRGGWLSVRPEVQASFDREIQKRLAELRLADRLQQLVPR